MKAWAGAATLLLIGCSPPSAAEPGNAAGAVPQAQAEAAGAPSAAAPAGGALTGQVSGLVADVSDLRVRITDMETLVDLPTDVLFAFDSADLAPAADAPLRRVLAFVAQGAAGDIRVVGHTDAKGEDAYNLDLSLRRARAVGTWLGANGVAAGRIKPEGRGEAEPAVPNAGPGGADDPSGRALNRRVQLGIPR